MNIFDQIVVFKHPIITTICTIGTIASFFLYFFDNHISIETKKILHISLEKYSTQFNQINLINYIINAYKNIDNKLHNKFGSPKKFRFNDNYFWDYESTIFILLICLIPSIIISSKISFWYLWGPLAFFNYFYKNNALYDDLEEKFYIYILPGKALFYFSLPLTILIFIFKFWDESKMLPLEIVGILAFDYINNTFLTLLMAAESRIIIHKISINKGIYASIKFIFIGIILLLIQTLILYFDCQLILNSNIKELNPTKFKSSYILYIITSACIFFFPIITAILLIINFYMVKYLFQPLKQIFAKIFSIVIDYKLYKPIMAICLTFLLANILYLAVK